MLTAVFLLLSVALVVVGGESVRGQCRRMLTQPLVEREDAMTAPVTL